MLISVFVGLFVVVLCLFSGERRMRTIESGKVEPGTAV